MIKFRCGCGQKIGVPEAVAGKRVKCPGCGNAVVVPAASAMTEAGAPQKPAAAPKPTRSAPPPARVEEAASESPADEPALNEPSLLNDALVASESEKSGEGDYDLAIEPEVAPVRAAPATPKADAPRSVTPARKAPAASQPSDPTEIKQGSTVRAIIGATIAAGIGAVVWGGIGAATGYEVGWVAWGIGLFVGLGAAIAANGKGVGVAVVAAVMAVAGIGVGKVLSVNWMSLSKKDLQEYVNDEKAMANFVVLDMAEKKQFPPDVLKAIDDDSDLTDSQSEAIMSQANTRLKSMSPHEKESVARAALGKIIGRIPFHTKLIATLGPLDALWAFLAIATAFRLGYSGGGDSDG